MRRTLLVLVVSAAAARTARAESVLYFHPHPISPRVDAGMCHIEGPHVHSYKPHSRVLYRRVDNRFVFVGDPAEFDAKHQKYAYYGHHPLFWVDNGDGTVSTDEYCFITGPHYHWYAPPADLKFKMQGDAYWYVGVHPPWYEKQWPRHHRPIARHYARVNVAHPVVTVTPPSGFVGVYLGAEGPRAYGAVGAGARVVFPSIVIQGGAGVGVGVGVGVSIPGVGITIGGGPRGHHRRPLAPWARRRYKRKRHGPPAHAPAWGYRRKHRRGHGKKKRGKW